MRFTITVLVLILHCPSISVVISCLLCTQSASSLSSLTGVLMAAGNFGAQCILKSKGKQKGIIYKKVSEKLSTLAPLCKGLWTRARRWRKWNKVVK